MNKVNFILTIDVHQRENLKEELRDMGESFDRLAIHANVLIPAILLSNDGVSNAIVRLSQKGHQIGCHGLYHDGEIELYDEMSYELQDEYISKATSLIRNVVGYNPVCFRSPTFRLSASTIQILEKYGYTVDCSVNSQRLGLTGADYKNISWLLAPRLPYHPSYENPYKRGNTKLLEVPTSAFVFPFMSTFLKVFGLGITKLFFKMFYLESLRNKKPIVYMGHPEDFSPSGRINKSVPFSYKLFLPSKDGFRFRYLLYERDEKKVYNNTIELFKYIKSYPGINFVTFNQYLESL